MINILSTEKVLIDLIMLVTINLKPFKGHISMEHYHFNPCRYKDIYRRQIVGNYSDTFKDLRHGINRSFLTTCVDARIGEFPSGYKELCKNIVSRVCLTLLWV